MQKGREGREGKKRGDCVTRCLLLSHSWAFTEGKTRIEDPRTSGILMKFLPLPSAISGKEGEDPSLFVSLSFSFSSLSKRFTERALIPSAGCIRSSSMNRGRGKWVMGGVCSTQFSPMQITSVYYFARKKGEEEGR